MPNSVITVPYFSFPAIPPIAEYLVDKELNRVEKVHPDSQSMKILMWCDIRRNVSIKPH